MTPSRLEKEFQRLIDTYGKNSVVFRLVTKTQTRDVTLGEFASHLKTEDKTLCNRSFVNSIEKILKTKKPQVKHIQL